MLLYQLFSLYRILSVKDCSRNPHCWLRVVKKYQVKMNLNHHSMPVTLLYILL